MIGELLQGMLSEAFDLDAKGGDGGNRRVIGGAYGLVAPLAGGRNALGGQKHIDAPGPLGP